MTHSTSLPCRAVRASTSMTLASEAGSRLLVASSTSRIAGSTTSSEASSTRMAARAPFTWVTISPALVSVGSLNSAANCTTWRTVNVSWSDICWGV